MNKGLRASQMVKTTQLPLQTEFYGVSQQIETGTWGRVASLASAPPAGGSHGHQKWTKTPNKLGNSSKSYLTGQQARHGRQLARHKDFKTPQHTPIIESIMRNVLNSETNRNVNTI